MRSASGSRRPGGRNRSSLEDPPLAAQWVVLLAAPSELLPTTNGLPTPGAKTPPQQEHYQYFITSVAVVSPVITHPLKNPWQKIRRNYQSHQIGRNKSNSRSSDRRRSRSIESKAVDYSESE
jgi:hypothetical protein